MSSLLNVGARALMANQTALQTAGHNIANVNTVGYSRQSAVSQTVQGQFTGSGYIGKGVEISTIERTYSEFLTRQSALAGATSSGDTARAEKLKQLEALFQGGTNGLGAAVSDMLNAFSDVANSPTDLTARTVALTKVSETALRLRGTAANLDDLQQGLTLELKNKVNSINSIASGIAAVNEKIARATGTGQPPNDLYDQRDQLVRDLNQYIQTSSTSATDGTVSIFVGGSQALVLGNTSATLSLTGDTFNDPTSGKVSLTRNGQTAVLDENVLGGGEVPGLLRFQNTDMAEARNLLGRYTLGISTSMNDQHKLGVDMNGNPGQNLLTQTVFGTGNILQPTPPATLNSAAAGNLTMQLSDVTQLVASDYELSFSSSTQGVAVRRSDGVTTGFSFTPGTATTNGSFSFFNPATGLNDLPALDGLSIGSVSTSAPQVGDRFLLKPYSTSASNIQAEFSSARALAVANPLAGKMGSANTGSLQLTALRTLTNPPLIQTTGTPVTLNFVDTSHFTRSDDTGVPKTQFNYTPNQAIGGSLPATTPPSQWSLTLQGTPRAGDTFTIQPQASDMRNLNADNASALMNLRDLALFDGAAMTDGYAGLISQIGIRTQSANYSAEVSSSLAANLEKDRTGVSGVNLDEEAAKLLQYQQAYQASAKMIQVAQGIFDTLIQTLGR